MSDKFKINIGNQKVDVSMTEAMDTLNWNSFKESYEVVRFHELINKLKIKHLDEMPQNYHINLHYSDYLRIFDDININLSVLRNYDIENAEKIIKTTIYDDIHFIFNRIKRTKLTDKLYPHQKPTSDGYIYLRKVDK